MDNHLEINALKKIFGGKQVFFKILKKGFVQVGKLDTPACKPFKVVKGRIPVAAVAPFALIC